MFILLFCAYFYIRGHRRGSIAGKIASNENTTAGRVHRITSRMEISVFGDKQYLNNVIVKYVVNSKDYYIKAHGFMLEPGNSVDVVYCGNEPSVGLTLDNYKDYIDEYGMTSLINSLKRYWFVVMFLCGTICMLCISYG